MEDLFVGLAFIAGIWTLLELAIEVGVKYGIKGALKDITIKVDTYDHR